MIKAIEEKFVKNYVLIEHQKRLFYELCNKKKRNDAIRAISYRLDERFIVLKERHISDLKMKSMIKSFTEQIAQVYIISDFLNDGVIMDFELIYDSVMKNGGTSILIFEDIVFLKDEMEYTPLKYIVKRKRDGL